MRSHACVFCLYRLGYLSTGLWEWGACLRRERVVGAASQCYSTARCVAKFILRRPRLSMGHLRQDSSLDEGVCSSPFKVLFDKDVLGTDLA